MPAPSSTSSATTPPLRSYPSVPTSESAFFASISPTFSALTQAFFLHLLKVLVAHAAIAEDNPAIFVTFIHNLHSKHHHHQLSSLLKSSTSSGSSSGGKRPGSATSASSKGGHFGGRDKPLLLLEPAALKKELASKGSKKMEAFAYDPLYLRLFEYLKAYHRNKKSSIGGKAEKCALLSTSLRCMGQLMEVVDPHASPSSSSPSSSSSSSPTTVFHLLEDILVYLRLVFELDPTSVVATVRQLLRCAFAVNYVSLFVDLLADQLSGRLGPLGSSSISLATSSATITTPTTANTTTATPTTTTAFKCEHMNSLYNSCLSMPYSRLNEFYNNCQRAKAGGGGGTAAETENSIGFLTWLRERTHLSHHLIFLNFLLPLSSSSVLTDSEMKSLLIAKIQLLEPLVLKSFSRYKSTNDRRFQAALAELLATLVQLQVNFCSLDTDNVFIGHVLKQFEFLENVGTRELQAAYEPLMRRLFYFLVILSNGRYISEELVDLPKVIQLCDAFIANGHHQMAVQGLAIVVDDCFYFKGEHLTLSTGGSDSVANLEATREVVLAFAFKLLDHHPQAFDLLTMIVAYYQGSSRPRWSSLSATVIELLLPKLVDPNFERLISSAQAFESLQTLLYRLCPAVFTSPSSTVTFNLAAYLFKRRSNSSSKSLWRTVLFLRLIIFNLSEAESLAKTEEIRESIDYISFGSVGGVSGDDSPAGGDGGDEATSSPDPPPPEELLASLLFGVLQQALGELAEDLGGYRSRRSSRAELTVYLLAQYTLSLAFVFQSGFFPRVTACATQLIGRCQLSKSGGAPAAKLQPVVVVVNDLPYDFSTTNELFFRLAAFHPHLTISWLNLLYITNYERLPNLENVEYLSWLVINHLREIVDLCYEVPVREFIHSVHRRSSSSGLFLQAVNSRCAEQLSLNSGNSTTTSVDPLFASKLLHCLERAHSSQSLPLVLFLLEQYLFNAALAPYYNCSKAAEVIAASRLASLYDLNDHATSAPPKATETIVVSGGAPETPPPPKNLLSLKDLSNLRKLLRNTSYVKLSYTVQTIKNQYFGVVGSSGSVSRSGRKKSAQIRDPLTESFQSLSGAAGGGDLRNSMPEINRRWFIGDILRPYWAVAQRSTPNAVHFLDKLANEDIGELVASEHFSLVNLKQILVYLVEKAKERGSVGGGGNFSGHYQHKAAAAHLVESSNREELAKEMLAFCRRLMQYTLLRCPLQLATLLKERQFLSSEGEEEAFFSLEESQFSAVAFSFLPSFEFLLRHQSLLEAQAGGVSLLSADSPEQQCLDTDLLLVYATLVPPTFRQNRLVQLTDLLTLLRSALIGNGGGGVGVIRAVYFVVEQCFTLSDEIELPAELTAFGRGSEQFERHIFADLKRVLLMFHWLEESESAPALKHRKHRKKRSSDSGVTSSAQWSSPLPPVLGRLLEELVISLAQLPFVNSLVYLPYSLFARKTGGHYHQSLTAAASPSGQHSFWREASFSGDFHTSTPIIGAQYLSNDLDLFRSFARRIELLGFVNRVQFEEIWMTLLGVYSDNLTFMSLQAKQQQPSISGERNTELNDSLQLGQLVVRSVTTLLLTAAGRNTGKKSPPPPPPAKLPDRRRTSKQSFSAFGDRFELIREALSRRSSELEEVLAQYNASSTTTSSSPCLQFADAWEGMGLGSSCGSRSFCSSSGSRNASSESSPTGDSSSNSAQASSNDTSVDLYSCLHFLIDLYLQTVQVLTSGGSTTTGQKDSHPLSTVCFPVFAEIGRSCLAVSELLFTEKSQYAKLLTLLHELARLVDAYEDELLNQSVIVALARTHAVLGFSDETIERAKRLVLEQHFKDFFLPTRIGAVRSVKHLLESRLLPLTTKELAPVCDYIAKHFTNEHCIPSSYSAEYVEELWSLALALVRRTSVPSLGGDFNDKVVKGLLRSLSKCGGGSRIHGASNVRSVCACLEQLLLMYSSSSNQMGISAGKDHHQHTSKEVVVAIHSAALKQLTLCTGQLNSVSLLRLYVLASYLVSPGATNFPGRQPANVKSPTSSADIFGGDDELFSSLEQLSVIFEPLKTGQCNSLQAAALCSVLGHFLVDFFPAQDLLNKCIGEFLSNQQNHYKYLTDILFVIFNKFQTDFHHTDTAQDWVLLSLSSFTQLVPISHALWALTCFLMAASQNHWIRASYPYFQHRFGQFNERDKAAFFTICNNFYNEIKSEENKRAFIKTFQKAAASLPNSPYFDVLKYLCDI
ncbi:hypothetical protein TYRP_007677 [Tyrophagus putrescentiae]|nr:hypothetical protein TYRP_007677 [Tyrophagus putrescentiae]